MRRKKPRLTLEDSARGNTQECVVKMRASAPRYDCYDVKIPCAVQSYAIDEGPASLTSNSSQNQLAG